MDVDPMEVAAEVEDRLISRPCEQGLPDDTCRDYLPNVTEWCDTCLVAELLSAINEKE